MTRRFLRGVCRWLAGAVLFAQLAVAAHACPGLAPAMSAQSTGAMPAAAAAAMNCEDMAGSMAPSFAQLCAEHCRQGQQSDHAANVSVPAALFNALYLTPRAAGPLAAPRPAADAASALVAVALPHTIAHCCFRI